MGLVGVFVCRLFGCCLKKGICIVFDGRYFCEGDGVIWEDILIVLVILVGVLESFNIRWRGLVIKLGFIGIW